MIMNRKPITITIDVKLDKEIRNMQASFIKKSNRSWSYSSVLNLILEEGLKSFKKK